MNELEIQNSASNAKICVKGIWNKDSVVDFENFKLKTQSQSLIFDFSSLKDIDMAGVCFFLNLEYELKIEGKEVSRQGLNAKFGTLFELCAKNYAHIDEISAIKKENFFVQLGKKTISMFKVFKVFLVFMGEMVYFMFHCLLHPKEFRFVSFLYHVQNSIINATPIIVLTSLLVGVVLAYQAAYQLQQFGANIFIVDLMGISATREIAPLIAAIVIAGRSASSYTAQIGVMKITSEVDAMNTMGFDSARFIILPRVLALTLAMPLIVAVADFVSILGGMLVAQISLDINPGEFIRRFKEAVALKHILIGLAKAPAFGFIIGLIACFRGFEVKDTTESIGIYTTKSVVNAIFWVIAFDAIFSIFLTQAGL